MQIHAATSLPLHRCSQRRKLSGMPQMTVTLHGTTKVFGLENESESILFNLQCAEDCYVEGYHIIERVGWSLKREEASPVFF